MGIFKHKGSAQAFEAIRHRVTMSIDRNSKDHKGVAHWSKDYVEHLRTIHFSLMAVSVGLIALSLARPTGTLERALVQLREIQEVNATSNATNFSWTDVWKENQIRRAIDSGHVQPRIDRDKFIADKGDVTTAELLCAANEVSITVALTSEWRLFTNHEDFKEPYRKFMLPVAGRSIWPIPDDKLYLSSSMTLADFQDTWNFLASNIEIAIPNHVQNKAYMWDAAKESWTEYKCGPIGDKKSQTFGASLPILSLGIEADGRWPELHQLVGNDTSELGYVSHDRSVFLQVDEFRSIPFDGQAWFMTRFPHWDHGQFKESFPELSEVSSDFRSEELGTVERILRAQQSKSADSFEAFGIKLPAEIVTRFGILLIVAVQLYFAIHLSELSGRLQPDDPGWEVAWIGVYRHKLARIMYFFSVFLLPLGAVVALGVRGLIEFSYSRWSWLTLILGVVFSTGIGTLIHLNEPAISKQCHADEKIEPAGLEG